MHAWTLVVMLSAAAGAQPSGGQSRTSQRLGSLSTTLPGTIRVFRVRSSGEVLLKPSRLTSLKPGRYVLRYESPEARNRCRARLVVKAGGTNHQSHDRGELRQIRENYRSEILPALLAGLNEKCTPQERLEVRLQVWNGLVQSPDHPTIVKASRAETLKRYGLEIDGQQAREYEPGEPLELGPGQQIHFVELPEAGGALALRGP